MLNLKFLVEYTNMFSNKGELFDVIEVALVRLMGSAVPSFFCHHFVPVSKTLFRLREGVFYQQYIFIYH